MVLYSQLKIAKKITKKRINLFKEYLNLFEELEIQNLIKRPYVPNYCNLNGHIFYIIIKKNKRDLLIRFLKKKKIHSVFHYIPLHSSPFGKYCTKTKLSMKNTNFVANNLLRLPLHPHLKQIDQIKILKEIKKFFTLKKYKDIL